ncbi:PQQ-dependent sugar dehydrogenase [Actinocorallia aurantiaca]|jgi:glucose/arabinose dehydrogenase|uniref:PQQ-dependent sugar dehydrogenase n=1 Tax=Actinocorallia aurantiaca TaxID=46204 RepID=A0ABN3U812_9ACTN
MHRSFWFVSAVTAGALLAGCAGDESVTESPSPEASASKSTGPQRAAPGKVKLTELAEVEQPTGMAVREGDSALYVIEQPGRVRAIRDGKLVPEPVLDLAQVAGGIAVGGERGLLGLAFSPDGEYLYLDYTAGDGTITVVEYPVREDGSVKQDGRRVLLEQPHPRTNHNGGQLAFGPDGHLYISLGDGGGAGDPDGNGQNLGSLLGKILRIDPRGGRPYEVPADNPFADKAGAKPEIWAYGLRNPWRFSFDKETGDLWIGDVGQDDWEEVDFQPASSKGGENYGWPLREGSHEFRSGERTGVVPVHEYELHQDNECSVIGGYVYRGEKLTGLKGNYVYADFCAGWVKSFKREGGKAQDHRTLLKDLSNVSAFGQDGSGELYVLSLNGQIYRMEPA